MVNPARAEVNHHLALIFQRLVVVVVARVL
jgi:hypothetical protein